MGYIILAVIFYWKVLLPESTGIGRFEPATERGKTEIHYIDLSTKYLGGRTSYQTGGMHPDTAQQEKSQALSFLRST
jgi:hypothetical protein